MLTIEGKAGIIVKVLADSISPQGIRLMTYELTYPRIIHSELLTHKMLCSASASSRAIPFAKMSEQLTARPVRFGQANPGMQDKGEDYGNPVQVPRGTYDGEYHIVGNVTPERAWELASKSALKWAEAFYSAGYHKQVYNRRTEPDQMIKTVMSGTEFGNFFWLRNHEAADPTLHELAKCMWEAREKSVPILLQPGEWHLPYVDVLRDKKGRQQFYIRAEEPATIMGMGLATPLTIEQAIKVSAARCAAVSFRNEDYGLEKCLQVYERLVGDDRKHASAFQHQATPMQPYQYEWKNSNAQTVLCINDELRPHTWEAGISHVTRDGQLWSAQFRGWIMNRKLIPGECYVSPEV